MTDPHQPAPVVDPLARQLVGGLLTGLALLVPLRGALGAPSTGWVVLWLLAAVLLAVGLGWLFERGDFARPFATSLTTAGLFAVLTLAGLALLASLGDPGGDDLLALAAGVPAAAIAAVAAPVVIGLRTTDEPVIAATLGGVLVALVASSGVGGMIRDAREEAATAAELATSRITPYVPEIDGLEPTLEGPVHARAEGGGPSYVAGYTLDYTVGTDGDPWDAASVALEVRLLDDDLPCTEIPDEVVCEEGDGYVVEVRDGQQERVVADVGDTRLVATFRPGEGELPSVADLGRALDEAEPVEWAAVAALAEPLP